jgi:hypothetical protein
MPRHRFRPLVKPPLTEEKILAWADEFRTRHGFYPKKDSGLVPGELTQMWSAVDTALRKGMRGLPGGSSLSQLLAKHRDYRHLFLTQRLTREQILRWADAHRRRTGDWPTKLSGAVADAPGETWSGIDAALYAGVRGLRGGQTLADLLYRQRGVLNRKTQPPLTIAQILIWAEAQHALFGAWPSKQTGPIGNTGESWEIVNAALRLGLRGLPGGSSLSQLLKEHGKFEGRKPPIKRRKK